VNVGNEERERRASRRAYQASLLVGASRSLGDCLASRLSSLPVQRTTTGREPKLANAQREIRLRGESVFVDQAAEPVAAADAVEVDHLGGAALVGRR
jgi:hypothetical protein